MLGKSHITVVSKSAQDGPFHLVMIVPLQCHQKSSALRMLLQVSSGTLRLTLGFLPLFLVAVMICVCIVMEGEQKSGLMLYLREAEGRGVE